jgi:hypothetical protein
MPSPLSILLGQYAGLIVSVAVFFVAVALAITFEKAKIWFYLAALLSLGAVAIRVIQLTGKT